MIFDMEWHAVPLPSCNHRCFLKVFFQCKDILSVLEPVTHLIHQLLCHKDAQSPDLTFTARQSDIRIGFFQRIIRLSGLFLKGGDSGFRSRSTNPADFR